LINDLRKKLMTLDDLLAEATSLTRPCFLLGESLAGRFAGYWGGERKDIPNAVPPEATRLVSRSHIITIDPVLFAELDLPQVNNTIGIFETRGSNGENYLSVDRRPSSFADISCTGSRLHAVPAASFPPFQAVCLYGSDKVGSWLASLGLERFQYEAASSHKIAQAYETEFMRRAPFYNSGADVIIGGWHMVWPDDDFFMPLEMRLIATTLRDAEPFLEVWLSELGNMSVKARIT
jgi:hypothetical protein